MKKITWFMYEPEVQQGRSMSPSDRTTVNDGDPTLLTDNPFKHPQYWRKQILYRVKFSPSIDFSGKGFICTLITSRCPVGCAHCMFFSNMSEAKNEKNTFTEERLTKLMKLVRDSNTGYLLISGGGEGFLEPNLMYRIAEETMADHTWLVTSGYWAKERSIAERMVRNLYEAFLRGNKERAGRRVYLRLSIDEAHVKNISRGDDDRFRYVLNLIRTYEEKYRNEHGFLLMLHSLEGEERLIDELCKRLSGEKLPNHDLFHKKVKVTQAALTIRLKSGYEIDVTFAKHLLADLAADMRDEKAVKEKIAIFQKDANENQRGRPAVHHNLDGTIGTDLLVIYDGRVAGGWQAEMPDVDISLDADDFRSIMHKTLTDPGVFGTVERGLAYRNAIINEVCPKAVMRSQVVNIRDYSSSILFEEDTVKLYYTIRVLQDYIAGSRIGDQDMKDWPDEIHRLVNMTPSELQVQYHAARRDIVQQFIEKDGAFGFERLMQCIKRYRVEKNPQDILGFFNERPDISNRMIDKWRLLLERIANGWYDMHYFNEAELGVIEDVERLIDERVLTKKRYHEGLSFQ